MCATINCSTLATQWGNKMTKVLKERLNVRVSGKRLQKLRGYAISKDKTMTQIVEDWIDTLKLPKSTED
jgi:hypothetical protein